MTTQDRAAILAANLTLAELQESPLNSGIFKKVDPYLKWALITGFEGYRKTFGENVPFLIHVPDEGDRQSVSALGVGIKVNGAYLYDAAPNDKWTEYATGLVGTNAIVALHEEIVLNRKGACKFGLPAATQIRSTVPSGGVSALLPGLFFGIIDHGIAYAHRSFQDSTGNTSRIVELWDQDPESVPRNLVVGADWRVNSTFGYGAVINAASINVAKNTLGETKTYTKSGYIPVEGPLSHGTHVLDLAVGKGRGVNALPDAVENAAIYAVQLPWRPFKDTSGASLCVHILDALQWMQLSAGGDVPIVVNISDGAYAGPGKGRSLLERALNEMLKPKLSGKLSDMRLVLAAGNGAKRRGHASGELTANNSSGRIAFQVLPDTPIDTMIEVWIDSSSGLDSYNGEVSLALTTPTAETITVNLSNDLAGLTTAGGKYIAMANATDQSPDCPNLLGFVVAISPTRPSPSMKKRGLAPHGLWSIEVKNDSNEAISFSAQIQRSNPALGDKGYRREAKFAKGGVAANFVTSYETLNNIATGINSITVGGCLVKGNPWPDPSDPARRELEVEYSSRGAAVSVVAPSDYSLGLHGVLAAGNRSGTTARMDGTSVAAPQVARALLNALAIPANRNMDNAMLLKTLTIPSPVIGFPNRLR